jgi:hypothetical protein
VESDFAEHYGLDLSCGLLEERSARWLAVRVRGLLDQTIRSRLRLALYPPKKGEMWL